MSLNAGDKLGPYQIISILGSGGMGQVYRARDSRLGRDVAVKVLPPEVANDPSRRRRFELEARAVAALNHPNIVAVYDVGDGYIVSELVEGEPLRGGQLGLRKTLEVAVQIAGGLAAAHDAGIVHRDLKPANILLAHDGRPKILDFGLAKMERPLADTEETVTAHTEAGMVMGTVGYMSPEQVRGLETDHRSDIFSFGVILHELLSGKRPFRGETNVDTMQAILRQEAPELPETVPPGVRQIVGHCLEKERGKRFQSARDLEFALSALGQSGGHSKVADAPGTKRISIWGALAAFAMLGVGVVGTLLVWRPPAAPLWTGVLLGGPEKSSFPRPSPDGHWVAFIANIGDFTQVAVMKPESGNVAVLTHVSDQGLPQNLSWSPDGTKIYFDRYRDGPRGIYSVPVLGGDEKLVVEDAGYPEALPDGSLLAAKLNPERQYQYFRYWPETGRSKELPLEYDSQSYGNLRAFPDGQEAVALATPIGADHASGKHLYAVNVDSGQLRRIQTGSIEESRILTVAVTRDGKSVLIAAAAGNVHRVVALPRHGSGANNVLLSLTNTIFNIDSGPDGSIYLDQMDRPGELLKFSAGGGPAERIATLPPYEGPGVPTLQEENMALLPDGRAVITEGVGGRMRLMVVEPGKETEPLLVTSEETSAPVAAAGPGKVAFLIGPSPRQTIALAATANGQIMKRIPLNKGSISALAASPDGKTIYCAADGMVWSIPVDGGEAKKVRSGDYLAMDPAGEYLLVEVFENPAVRLIQVPLKGGAEREVPAGGALKPTFMIGPNAVGKDGRILTPLSSSTWFWPCGVIDPKTGKTTIVSIDIKADFHSLGWTPDGKVMGLGLPWHTRIWKFQPEKR